MSRSRDAGVKPKLIKRLYKLGRLLRLVTAVLIIIALALFPLRGGAFVTEQPAHTYSPEVLGPINPDTTQPDLDKSKTAGTTPNTVEEKILKAFPDVPIMVEVARCESQLDPLADRGNLNVDVGLFQINQVHNETLVELGLDRRDIDDNIAFARILFDQSGLAPWYMSKNCWAKFM